MFLYMGGVLAGKRRRGPPINFEAITSGDFARLNFPLKLDQKNQGSQPSSHERLFVDVYLEQ